MYLEAKADGEARVQHPSVAGFVQWLGTQNPDARYEWGETMACACAQYAEATGTMYEWAHYGTSRESWRQLNEIAAGHDIEPANWTFGQCLERANRFRLLLA